MQGNVFEQWFKQYRPEALKQGQSSAGGAPSNVFEQWFNNRQAQDNSGSTLGTVTTQLPSPWASMQSNGLLGK